MSHTPEYEKLLAELNAGELPIIERKILEVLYQAPKGLTSRWLVRIVFGQEARTNLGNDTKDRKIHKAIESLRNRGIPILSNSGKAGYKLDTDPENIECMVRELKRRIIHLQQRVGELAAREKCFSGWRSTAEKAPGKQWNTSIRIESVGFINMHFHGICRSSFASWDQTG